MLSAPSATSNRQPIDILCFRHGETFRNENGLIQGRYDGPEAQLNSLGKEQAEKIGLAIHTRYPNLTKFYTSHLGRCLETAERVAKYFQNAQIIKRDDLKAVNHGNHDGMYFKIRNEFCAQYYKRLLETQAGKPIDPLIKWKDNPLAGAETYYQAWERAVKTLIDISEDCGKDNSCTQIALSSNTVFMQSLITRSEYEYKGEGGKVLPLFFELPQPLPNCVVAHFRYHPEEPKFERKIQFIGIENFQ